MAAHSPMVAILLLAVVILAVQSYRLQILDPCTLAPWVVPCEARMRRFYYDHKEEKCTSFNFGSCSSNSNNFKSMWDCQQKCSSGKGHASNRAYMLAMRCAMSLDKHMFSSDVAGACKEIPKVITCMESHMHECKGVRATQVRARLDNYRSLNTDKCQGQGQGRPCDNSYCSDHGRCRMIGGPNVQAVPFCKCDPNFSGFHCEHYSGPGSIPGWEGPVHPAQFLLNSPEGHLPRQPQVDICTLPPYVGPCKAMIARFYYDNKEEKCTSFVYGGCSGNGNSFGSMESCQQKCASGKESARLDRVFNAIKSGSCDTKSWPSVVGMSFEEAKATILLDCSYLKVYRMLPGSAWTHDFSPNRVRVSTDAGGVVVRTPNIA